MSSAPSPSPKRILFNLYLGASSGTEQRGREVDHSPSGAKMKNEWSCASAFLCRPSWRGQGQRYLLYAPLRVWNLRNTMRGGGGAFVHLAVCLTTGPKPLPKRAVHIVRSRASSFEWEYPLLSLRSSSSFLRLLPRLPVTSIPPYIFPSITCCRRQFLRKMWPIQFAFRLLISCRIFLCSLTLSNTSLFLRRGSIFSRGGISWKKW